MDERFGRRYDDDERRYPERAPREYEYEGRSRPYGRRSEFGCHERGFLDRAGDEVRSWFGDEDAEQRRRDDERRARWSGRSSAPRSVEREGSGWSDRDDRERRGWGDRDEGERRGWSDRDERERRGASDVDEREWARQWGYVGDPSDRRRAFGGRPRDDRWNDPSGESRGPRGDYWVAGGPFAGRGPKGYRRSDDRIREDLCDLLCEHGALDASDVEVQVVAGEVTLVGFVPTRPQKRLAEDLADSVPGVTEVHNQLRTAAPAPPPSEPSAPTSPPGPSASQDWRNRAA